MALTRTQKMTQTLLLLLPGWMPALTVIQLFLKAARMKLDQEAGASAFV
jgi:hypothetical protein